MLAIAVARGAAPAWRKTFAIGEIQIGRSTENHIVLDDDRVSDRHARVVTKDTKIILVDMKSATGTFVNGRKMTSPLVISAAARIELGGFTLAIGQLTAESVGATLAVRDRVEQDLLDAIAGGDDASRLVYADWLEASGDHVRAEFLRLQHELIAATPEDPTLEARTDRLRELAAATDLTWRSRVGRRVVEGCRTAAFDFACPTQWSAMAPTDREGVRRCGACKKDVFYCGTVEEAREHAARGACVALDVSSPRWTDDLQGPYGVHRCTECDVDVGYGLSQCPRCGRRLEARMVRGLMA